MGEQAPYILMVEDEPGIARLAAERLAGLGYEIKNVASAEEARAAIKERVPVLMLLDYMLPGENGLEFVESFKAAGEACPPFIVMTGHSAEEVAVAMLRAGARDYLVKGVSFLDPLKSAVKNALAELESARKLKTAGLALREGEGRYRSLFNGSYDALMTIDPVSGKFTSCNPAALRMFNVKNEAEFTAAAPWELSPELQADGRRSDEKARELLSSAVKNGSAFFEWTHKRADGEPFRAEVLLTRIDISGLPEFYACARDITARKLAEEKLLEGEEKFRTIINVSPVPMALNDEHGNITFLNQAFVQTFGYTRADIPALGDWWLKAYPAPEYRQWVADAWEAGIERAKKTGAGFSPMEVTVRCKNGMGKNVLASATSVSRSFEGEHLVVLYDITEHKQADSALREAFEMQGVLNAMLQRSIANLPVGEKLGSHLADLLRLPWQAVQPKGAVLLMNPGGTALVLTAQQGLPPFLLKACANVPLGRCLCGKAAKSGRTVESAEVGADHDITYEGMEPHGHCCTPIIAGGKTLGILNLYLKAGTALTDEQKRFVKHVTDIMAENILHARTQNELAQAQKMESVGRLAGGVAHDFNNILTAIKCYAGFLLKGLIPQDPKTADLREILAASDRAAGLTRQLLAFSRRQIMAPRVADLNECVANVTNMLRRLIGEDIKLTTKLASEPCLAMLDTGQIEQVLVNLVVNARDAMPGGGRIELATERLQPSGKLLLAHPDLPSGPAVCLKVADTGCGMTAEVKSHLYEPFYTTKEQGKGTGLGLSTVFGIVKQSGGSIEVESEPGKGTLFGIYFPYCESMPGAAAANNHVDVSGEVSGRETVLLVEDEENLRRLGKRILSVGGYTVLTAADGPEALKELERHGKPVDLLLTDVVLPGMNGRELALEIARRKLAGRTLYMSGYTDEAIAKHGVLEPGIAFIYKPFTVEALSAKLREVLDGPADQAKA